MPSKRFAVLLANPTGKHARNRLVGLLNPRMDFRWVAFEVSSHPFDAVSQVPFLFVGDATNQLRQEGLYVPQNDLADEYSSQISCKPASRRR